MLFAISFFYISWYFQSVCCVRTWEGMQESDVLYRIEPACSINREEYSFYVSSFHHFVDLGIENKL